MKELVKSLTSRDFCYLVTISSLTLVVLKALNCEKNIEIKYSNFELATK